MSKSLHEGRRDIEWWIPLVCAIALTLASIRCEGNFRLLLDMVRAPALGLMSYAGFWIAGRSPRKKYVGSGGDVAGGALMGLAGLVGMIIFALPWLVLFATYEDGRNGPSPANETAKTYEQFTPERLPPPFAGYNSEKHKDPQLRFKSALRGSCSF